MADIIKLILSLTGQPVPPCTRPGCDSLTVTSGDSQTVTNGRVQGDSLSTRGDTLQSGADDIVNPRWSQSLPRPLDFGKDITSASSETHASLLTLCYWPVGCRDGREAGREGLDFVCCVKYS